MLEQEAGAERGARPGGTCGVSGVGGFGDSEAMATTSLWGERSRERVEGGCPGLQEREGVSFAREKWFSRWREGWQGRGGGPAQFLQGQRPFAPHSGPPPSLCDCRPSSTGLGARLACRRPEAVPRVSFRDALSRSTCPPPESSPPTALGKWRLLSGDPWDEEGGGVLGTEP